MFICAILKNEHPEALTFETFEEFSEYATQMMRRQKIKEIQYYDLTCYYCDGKGFIGQEERSGGHIESEHCEKCDGSGYHQRSFNQLEINWNPPFRISID